MASVIRHGKKWRALIAKNGVRKSKVFPSRQEARDWAAREELLITGGEKLAASTTLGDVLDRYAQEVSPGKKGHRWEIIRLEKWMRDPVARHRLSDLEPRHLAAWRDQRLSEVSPGSVRREMNLLSAVLQQCVREWGLLRSNPMLEVKKPKPPPPRDRLPTDDEMERLAEAAGDLGTLTGRAYHAFLFAVETGMRAGEICGLSSEHVNGRVAHLPMTKNGRPRDVPLSSRALELWVQVPEGFGLTSRQLDTAWRRLRDTAKVEGLTFHDSRGAAATKLSKKLDPLELAKMLGHSDLSMLIRVYYRESAESIAQKLD
jgi:integrase